MRNHARPHIKTFLHLPISSNYKSRKLHFSPLPNIHTHIYTKRDVNIIHNIMETDPTPEEPTLTLTPLPSLRIPDYPNAPLLLNQRPLSILSLSNNNNNSHDMTKNIDPAIGIATILYNWHPTALTAFLDLDAWFSLTWSVSRPAPECGFEIGRIGHQITFGSLHAGGGETWENMVTYNILPIQDNGGSDEKDGGRGKWIPNPKESMRGEQDVEHGDEVERLARELVGEMLEERIWEAGSADREEKGKKKKKKNKVRHGFCVEYAPMDVWGDGIPMDVRWLYEGVDLKKCTCCGGGKGAVLSRCGRCGTATYCGDVCQRRDWVVHRVVCGMSMEDRGQALKLVEKGGLIRWDEERMFASEVGVMSGNPCFETPQEKRRRITD